MTTNIEVKKDAEEPGESARKRLVALTSEYYTLRSQYLKLSTGMISSSSSQGQMKSVLMAERLEEIIQETKRLLPVVYPHLHLAEA